MGPKHRIFKQPGPDSVCFNRQPPARGNDSSCSKQALFIRPRSKVADKKLCIIAVAVFVGTV